MPELPDLTIYLESLDRHVRGERLERLRIVSPFLLRTISPSPEDVEGRVVTGFRRAGKHTAYSSS